jgi:hypothetical protein
MNGFSRGCDMTTKTIDHEVVQRLTKSLDLVVLTSIALVLTLQAATYAISGVSGRIFLVAHCLCQPAAHSWLSNSMLSRLVQRPTTAVKSLAVGIFIAAVSLVAVAVGRPPIWGATGQWPSSRSAATYLSLTRLFHPCLVKASGQTGGLKQRIAIVGGGKAAEDAIQPD